MPYIVMYSNKPKIKSYETVINTGGGEVVDAKLYCFSHEAQSTANELGRKNDGYYYVVVPITVTTKRVINKPNLDRSKRNQENGGK